MHRFIRGSIRGLGKRAIGGLIPVLAISPALPSFAAEGLEEVIVTAQRKAQDVQDVPIAITAMTADAIEEADIHDATDIAARVPGMQYAEFAPGQALYSIRGVTSADDGAGMDNSVALFLDDVYIGRGASINFDLVDLERIEVLRGPQGTLYGKNAIGGAINVITQKPTNEFYAKLSATGGNEGIQRYSGVISGPLMEGLSGKLVASSRKHDGYVHNIILNKDQQDEDTQTYRGQLLWEDDDTEVLLSTDYNKDDREDMGRRPIADNSAPVVEIFRSLGGGFRKVAAPVDGFSKRKQKGMSLKVTQGFDSGELTAIASARTARTDWEMASVGVPLIAGAGDVIDEIHEDIDQFQLEVRYTGDLSDSLGYVAGAFYLNEQTDRAEFFRVRIPGVGDVANDQSAQDNETDSYAVFGQMTWDINDQWSSDFGLRYTKEKKDTASDMISGGFGIIGETFQADASENWSDLSPKVAVNFRPVENVTYYASIAKGFKSGGFQGAPGRPSDAVTPIDPETALNYEVGVKSDLFDRTLRLNATAFFTDYKDLQIVRFGPPLDDPTQFGAFTTRNAADAEMKGIELDFIWLVTDEFTLSGNYAYLNTEFTDFIFFDSNNNAVDLSGNDLRQAPENSYNLVAEYVMPLADVGDLRFRLDYRHMDESLDDVIDPRVVNEEFDLLDARVALRSADDIWEVAVWGKNLTDEEYISHSYTVGPGVIGIGNAPLTFGATVTWSFR